MVSNACSKIGHKVARLYYATSDTVAEIRSHKRHKKNFGEIETLHANWLPDEIIIHGLVKDSENFIEYLRIIHSITNTNPRSEMNRRLFLVTTYVFDSPQNYMRFVEHQLDVCDGFFRCLSACIDILATLYNVNTFKRLKGLHPPLLLAEAYGLDDQMIHQMIYVREFLAAPHLKWVLEQIMRIEGSHPRMEFPLEFVKRAKKDLIALIYDRPIPSFVVSNNYREECMPGAYPAFDEVKEPVQQDSEDVDHPQELDTAPVFIESKDITQKVAKEFNQAQKIEAGPNTTNAVDTLDSSRSIYSDDEITHEHNIDTYVFGLYPPIASLEEYHSECSGVTSVCSYESRSNYSGVEFRDGLDEKIHSSMARISRILESLNAPCTQGLNNRPPVDIVTDLLQQNRIDDSYRASQLAQEAEQKTLQQKAKEARLRAAAEALEEGRRKAEEVGPITQEPAERRNAKYHEQREQAEIRAKTGGLRKPYIPLISPVNDNWMQKAQVASSAGHTRILAKTGEGSDLRRHDFFSVLTPCSWLNDEIINGSIIWIDRAVNQAAGIEDVRTQTRKCLAVNSFFFKDLLHKGPLGTERRLRRCGVTRSNFLDVETMLFPICDNAHWTLLVVRPTKRMITHIDSLSPRGSQRFINLTLAWIEDILGERFVSSEWMVVETEAPAQMNGYDCGVFTITNAMCLALGLSPIHSYSADDMTDQRTRIACALLNGGFKDDFDLGAY